MPEAHVGPPEGPDLSDAAPDLALIVTFSDRAEEAAAHLQEAAEQAMAASRALLAAWNQDPSAADPTATVLAIGELRQAARRLEDAVEGVEAHARRHDVRVLGRREL